MSANSASSRISSTRPKSVSCRYQFGPSSTVTETRGSRRMFASRRRAESMFTRTRAPSQSYHVTAVCGAPLARSVAITAGFARLSSASASGGSGAFGILLPLLAPVPLEAEVRLAERGGAEVRACAVALARLEVGARGRDEVLLAHSTAYTLGPHREIVARLLDVLRDVLDARDDAEVNQRERFGLMAEDLVERLLPRLEVDLGRGCVRDDVLAGQDADARRVAGQQRPVVEQVARVVRRVARRRERFEPRRDVPDHLDVLLRHGPRLAVEPVQIVAVQAPRRRDESRRIDDVRRAGLRDVHADLRVLRDDVTGRAGVIEVDVRQQQVAHRTEV